MPHCVIEYSANVADQPDWTATLAQIHERLAATGEFALADIKSRVVRHEVFFAGDGARDRSFVAADLRILDGRSDERKRELSALVAEALRAAFPQSLAEQRFSLTVRVSDMHRASYRRIVSE